MVLPVYAVRILYVYAAVHGARDLYRLSRWAIDKTKTVADDRRRGKEQRSRDEGDDLGPTPISPA